MNKSEKTIDGLKVRQAPKKKIVVKNTTVKPATEKVKVVEKKVEPEKEVKPETKRSAEEAREDFLEQEEVFDVNIDSEELEDEIKVEKKRLKKERKKISKKRKIITSIILAFIILLIGAVIWILVWGNDLIARITGGNSSIWDAIGLITEDYVELKTDENGRTNILVFGTSGYDMNGTVGNNGTYDGSQLTDSIMVISLDQKTGDVAMMSVPRDLKAVKTCTSTGKINEVYWCNSRNGKTDADGAKALQNAVGEVFDINFQYYVHINWGSLRWIVNTLDGITVTLDEDINSYDTINTIIKAGVPTELNGDEALALARARHGTALGDFSRGNSQQKILIAIKDKFLEKNLSPVEVLGFVSKLGDDLRMDFSLDEIKAGVHLAQTLDLSSMRHIELLNWKNNVVYMKTANINGISYVIPSEGEGNYAKLQEYVAKMLESDPVAREEAKIAVLNGSGKSGAASALSLELENEGYKIVGFEDAPAGEYKEKYYIYDTSDDSSAINGTLKKLEERFGVKAKTMGDLPVGISPYNRDIIIIIGGSTEE